MIHEQGVFCIDENGSVSLSQEVIEFGFSMHNSFQASKPFQVRLPDVGDQSVGWLGHVAEECDLSGMIRPHLHNSDLRIRLNGEKS